MRYDYKDIGGIPESEIAESAARLGDYKAGLQEKISNQSYDVPEAGFISIVDAEQMTEAERVAEALGPVAHVVLIGIGGSSAGVEAVYSALRSNTSPMLHVLDILDSERLERTLASLTGASAQDLAVVIISKSGTTTETVANADVFLQLLREVHGEALAPRVVVIGDSETALQVSAQALGYSTISMPQQVGGRFSIYTVAGLIPLALAGVDIRAFVRGASTALHLALHAEESEALSGAALLHLHAERGTRIHVLFAESERMEGFARWWAQLLAESLGKEKDRIGKPFSGGLAPLLMSPRELHSTAQLYLSGFEGVLTTFIAAAPAQSEHMVKDAGIGSALSLAGVRCYARLAPAVMEGVHSAYQKARLPHAILDAGELTAESIGSLMAERMLEVACIAELGNIDAFDQPHVELYKKETRRILGGGLE